MVDLQLHTDTNPMAPRATEDQIKSASLLVKRVDLKNFSVCQFAKPGMFHILKESLCGFSYSKYHNSSRWITSIWNGANFNVNLVM